MSRNNSFDLIRHLAAIAVLISHQFALSGMDEPVVGMASLGTIGVIVFFSISGFLITASWERSNTASDYLLKRCYRIFPALIVCSFLLMYFVVPVFSKSNGLNYIFSKEAFIAFFRYSLLQYNYAYINNFTSDYIFKDSINGSLWTLKFEFFDYLLIAAILFTKRNIFVKSIVVLALAVIIFKLSGTAFPRDYYVYRGAATLIPFATGSVIYTSGITKSRLWVLALPISTIIIIAALIYNEYASFQIGLAILTLFVGTSIKDSLINGKFDISYGIYIYAFPVQQVVINELKLNFISSTLVCMALTICLALMSWHFVEKRFIFNRSLKLTNKGQAKARS